MSIKDVARNYLNAGLNIIPVHPIRKLPTIGDWMQYQKGPMDLETFEKCFADHNSIGVLTGGAGRIVCFDIDSKYDLSGTLFERFSAEIPMEIRKKLLCESTRNKGYHFVFRAPASRLKPNEKLAARPTTPDEQHITYMEAFKDFTKKDTALRSALNDSMRVLIETRSGSAELCGGYFICYPSEGYTRMWGKIGELTEDEYDTLDGIARSFNQVKSLHQVVNKLTDLTDWVITPFDDYNENGDPIEVLESCGWDIIEGGSGKNVRLKRPGQTYSSSSALFDNETRLLNVFSTSTCFEPNKGYDPVGIFTILMCEGNGTEAYKELIRLGYGKKK